MAKKPAVVKKAQTPLEAALAGNTTPAEPVATTSTTTTETPAETLTKTEMIRRAVAAGADQPKAGIAYIKEHFGIEIAPSLFSTVKFGLSKKAGTVVGSGRRSTKTPAANGTTSSDLALAIKTLINQFGVDEVRKTVDLAAMFMG